MSRYYLHLLVDKMLSQEENKRYNRHLILDQVGQVGQEKLKAAKVLVVGAGGLGCPVLQYLTAAGVGTIGIIDFDTVALSNLQRQILFTTADIGKNKAEVAADRLRQVNPHVDFQVYMERLSSTNALRIFANFDLIVDGTDNFSSRYLINDACVLTNKPLVFGSIYSFEGQVSVFNYQDGPSYRCLFPVPPKPGSVKNCSEIGVLGVLPGIIGTQQANEALKIILAIGEPLSGKLLIYDALNTTSMVITVQRSANEIEKVIERRADFEGYDYDLFCGIESTQELNQISLQVFKSMLEDESVRIIDLREEWEEPHLEGKNIERITMSEIRIKKERFRTDKQLVLICQTGSRSANVRQLLALEGINGIIELKGGMEHYE